MPPPLITVIIPTHERPDFLEVALASVRNQTYSHWEVIVVIDGTPPERYVKLKRLYQELRVTWVTQPKSGPGVARQAGLAAANGDYVCFLDDDDYYLPQHFELLIAATKETDKAIVRSGLLGKQPDGRLTKFSLYDNQRPTLEQYWKVPSNLTALLFTLEAARKVPIDTVRTTIEDFTWLLRVFSHHDLHQISQYTAVYVLHEGNRNNLSLADDYLADRINAMEGAFSYGEVARRTPKSAKKRWIHHQHLHYARNAFRAGAWRKGLGGVGRSFPYLSLAGLHDLTYTMYYLLTALLGQRH